MVSENSERFEVWQVELLRMLMMLGERLQMIAVGGQEWGVLELMPQYCMLVLLIAGGRSFD